MDNPRYFGLFTTCFHEFPIPNFGTRNNFWINQSKEILLILTKNQQQDSFEWVQKFEEIRYFGIWNSWNNVANTLFITKKEIKYSYLLLWDLKWFEVVSNNSQFFFEFDNLGLTGLCSFFSAFEVSLNHGQFSGNLNE